VTVSETTADRAMATLRVTANSRKSRDTTPPMSSRGMNTARSEAVIDTMVKPISRAPVRAACRGGRPDSR
jgi:hypothetical protein